MDIDLSRLGDLIPISSLQPAQIRQLAAAVRIDTLPRDYRLFEIDDPGTEALYVLSGRVRLEMPDGETKELTGGTPRARQTIATGTPRRCRAVVSSEQAEVARLDGALLDRVLTLGYRETANSGMQVQELGGMDAEDSGWMLSMLQSPTFLKLPAANIEALFARMQPLPVQAGEVLIRQGDPGDFYYMIVDGRAQVSRCSRGGTEVVLATLEAPQGFGEEALVSDQPRNATVTMLTAGRLMRLAKADFLALLEAPLLNWLGAKEATQLLREGAVKLDVRTEEEYRDSGLPHSLNIPLFLLRLRMQKLDRRRRYLVYCDSGARSSAAAFLLRQHGFDVYVLEGGLNALRS